MTFIIYYWYLYWIKNHQQMKNYTVLLLAILFVFSSCKLGTLDPFEAIDKSLSNIVHPFPGTSSVKLYTIEKSLNKGSEKQLMKMSIDYNTEFDHLGVFLYTEDQTIGTKTFKRLANIDLSDDKVEEFLYKGRKVLSLSEALTRPDSDKIKIQLALHDEKNNLSSSRILSKFDIFKPNRFPYGIQHYENDEIDNNDIIKLYAFDNRRGKRDFDEELGTVYTSVGQHAKLVMMYYDSLNEEDLLKKADWNINSVLNNRSEELRLINQLNQKNTISYSGSSDFKGFAFGQNGKN